MLSAKAIVSLRTTGIDIDSIDYLEWTAEIVIIDTLGDIS